METAETIAPIIRRLYLSGVSLKKIRRETAATDVEIERATRDLPRRIQRLSQSQIDEIQLCNGTVRAAARALRCSKSTVFYWRKKLYDQWSAAEADADEDDTKIEFVQLPTPRRCPDHGPTNVWPCVCCAALGRFDYD